LENSFWAPKGGWERVIKGFLGQKKGVKKKGLFHLDLKEGRGTFLKEGKKNFPGI